MWPQYNCIMCY